MPATARVLHRPRSIRGTAASSALSWPIVTFTTSRATPSSGAVSWAGTSSRLSRPSTESPPAQAVALPCRSPGTSSPCGEDRAGSPRMVMTLTSPSSPLCRAAQSRPSTKTTSRIRTETTGSTRSPLVGRAGASTVVTTRRSSGSTWRRASAHPPSRRYRPTRVRLERWSP